eukprot:COSAG01_NODE_1215_length_11206_cov_8.747096_5_plen_1561_part_00
MLQVWPELSPVNSNVWMQETNPFTDGAPRGVPQGYLPIHLHFSGDFNPTTAHGPNQLWQGLVPSENGMLADGDQGGGQWAALGAQSASAGATCFYGPVCNPRDVHCAHISGGCGAQPQRSGRVASFATDSTGFFVSQVELWVAAPPPAPTYFQISFTGICSYSAAHTCGGSAGTGAACSFPFDYQGVTYASCTSVNNHNQPWCYTSSTNSAWGNCECDATPGSWCASVDPSALGDLRSDLRLATCDSSDARQGFSYHERSQLLHVQSDPGLCLKFTHTDAHASCEPYTLAPCNENDDSQKFVLGDLRDEENPTIVRVHSVAHSIEIPTGDLVMYSSQCSDRHPIQACATSNAPVHLQRQSWQIRSKQPAPESEYVGSVAALFHSEDTMTKPVAEAYCIEHGGRLAVLNDAAKEGAAQQLLGSTDAWISAYCATESVACGTAPPGDASQRWHWYDALGRQLSSLGDNAFTNWNGYAGPLGLEGQSEYCAYHTNRGRAGHWEAEACDSPTRVALCEWPVSRIPGANFSISPGLRIVEATYGFSCGALGYTPVQRGNDNGHLQSECEGLDTCNYVIDHRIIGDPSYGCHKDYVATFDCGCGEQQAQAGGIGNEASGQTLRLSCDTCPRQRRPPPCTVTLYGNDGASQTGWHASFGNGDYDAAALAAGGARDNDVSSLTVSGTGCVVTLYDANDLDVRRDSYGRTNGAWSVTLPVGTFSTWSLQSKGAADNELSSMRVYSLASCAAPSALQWRISVDSVQSPSESEVQLLEIALVGAAGDQLGVGTVVPSVSPSATSECMKCGVNRFCVGFEGSQVFCYGASNGCLWNQNDCSTDADCLKYNTSTSPKYTDGDSLACPLTLANTGWRTDACNCGLGLSGLNNGQAVAIAEDTNCSPLPCNFTYSFPTPVSPAAVRLAHHDSPNRFPARITVSYLDSTSGAWTNFETMSVSDPPFLQLADYPLTTADCSAAVPSNTNQGHRRTQMFNFGNINTASCPFNTFALRASELDSVCCAGGSCTTGGLLRTCSFECALVFNSLYDDCHTLLASTVGTGMAEYDNLAEECFDLDARSLIYTLRGANCSLQDQVTDGQGWVLLLRQNAASGGFFRDAAHAAHSGNVTSHSASSTALDQARALLSFSRMDTIDSLRDSDGMFTFKFLWPDLSPINHNIWRQSSNPLTSADVTNYEAVEMQFDSVEYGLARSATQGQTLMDANEGNCWWMAAGSYSSYSGGIPGPICNSSDPRCSQVTGAISVQTLSSGACGGAGAVNCMIVPTVELWALSPFHCVGNSMCSQLPPFSCSNSFQLVSHIVVAPGDPAACPTRQQTGANLECASPQTAGACRYYINPLRTSARTTCSQWCAGNGMTCVGMYDDSGNSCSHQASGNQGCDFTGDTGDTDWICECLAPVDRSGGLVQGAGTPLSTDNATSKYSDRQINTWIQHFGHGNVMFKVVIDGNAASARYYKFDATTQVYTSRLLDYSHVCASFRETAGFLCGAAQLWDGNRNWEGLSSVANRGLGNCASCLANGCDGFAGIANSASVYDRCTNNQGAGAGTVDTYMKVMYAH